MSEVLKFKITSAVAAFVRPGVAVDKKLSGIQTAPAMAPSERLTLLFCLLKDTDETVKSAAESAFAELPQEVVLLYIQSADCHPSVLSMLAKIHHSKPAVADALLKNGLLSIPARQFLQNQQDSVPVAPAVQDLPPTEDEGDSAVDDEDPADDDISADDQLSPETDEIQELEPAEIDEDDEEFLSKYKIAMVMGIGEKIKMALTGDKEWRAILVKDANKLVSGSVIKNPRISDAEILNILKLGVQNDEIIRLICANKEWTKIYMIRKALINCPKTPLANSLRYLASMTDKDLASYAKSKNVASVISSQAKRMILAKQKKR
jgi:hypothetical protein